METLNDFLGLFSHNPKITFGVAFALPYVTRAFHGIRNGGGIRGLWRGIWFGTNTQTEKKQYETK